MNTRIDKMKESWGKASDDDIIKAVQKDWDGYSAAAQHIIISELAIRHLQIELKPITGKNTDSYSPHSSDWNIQVKIVFGIILIIVVNLALWQYYENRDSNALAKMGEIKAFLDNEKPWLENRERELTAIASQWEPERYNIVWREYVQRLDVYNQQVE